MSAWVTPTYVARLMADLVRPATVDDLIELDTIKVGRQSPDYDENVSEYRKRIARGLNVLVEYDYAEQVPVAAGCAFAYRLTDKGYELLTGPAR